MRDATDELWNEVIETNFSGGFYACRAVPPLMIPAGLVSNIILSPVHTVATVPWIGAYAASEGTGGSLTRKIAVEYADSGIRVNSLLVGSVHWKITHRHRELLERDGTISGRPHDQERSDAPRPD